MSVGVSLEQRSHEAGFLGVRMETVPLTRIIESTLSDHKLCKKILYNLGFHSTSHSEHQLHFKLFKVYLNHAFQDLVHLKLDQILTLLPFQSIVFRYLSC